MITIFTSATAASGDSGCEKLLTFDPYCQYPEIKPDIFLAIVKDTAVNFNPS